MIRTRDGSSRPSDSALVTNISNGYPVFGIFGWLSGYHAVTIYGINAITGYISVMDPEFGVTTALHNGTSYVYTSSYSGVNLILDSGICHSW